MQDIDIEASSSNEVGAAIREKQPHETERGGENRYIKHSLSSGSSRKKSRISRRQGHQQVLDKRSMVNDDDLEELKRERGIGNGAEKNGKYSPAAGEEEEKQQQQQQQQVFVNAQGKDEVVAVVPEEGQGQAAPSTGSLVGEPDAQLGDSNLEAAGNEEENTGVSASGSGPADYAVGPDQETSPKQKKTDDKEKAAAAKRHLLKGAPGAERVSGEKDEDSEEQESKSGEGSAEQEKGKSKQLSQEEEDSRRKRKGREASGEKSGNISKEKESGSQEGNKSSGGKSKESGSRQDKDEKENKIRNKNLARSGERGKKQESSSWEGWMDDTSATEGGGGKPGRVKKSRNRKIHQRQHGEDLQEKKIGVEEDREKEEEEAAGADYEADDKDDSKELLSRLKSFSTQRNFATFFPTSKSKYVLLNM